jgi:hypothetical protein
MTVINLMPALEAKRARKATSRAVVIDRETAARIAQGDDSTPELRRLRSLAFAWIYAEDAAEK